MKKTKVIGFLLLTLTFNFGRIYSQNSTVSQQEDTSSTVTTYYYDKNGKGVPTKDFASLYVVFSNPTDIHYAKQQRTFTINGQLLCESNYVSIDKYDHKKSVLDGDVMTYYTNGIVKSAYHLDNSIMNGEYIECFPNGNIKIHCHIKNGLKEGIYTEFASDKSCKQCEFKNDQLSKPFYAYLSKEGHVSRYRVKDNKLLMKSPNINQMHETVDANNLVWKSYAANGVIVMINLALDRGFDYGGIPKKVYKLNMLIQNKTNSTIQILPEGINGKVGTKKGFKNVSSISAETQAITEALHAAQLSAINALSETYMAEQAAYSTTSTSTSTNWAEFGASVNATSKLGVVIGKNHSAIGASNSISAGVSANVGQINTSSTSTTYDGYAAYQASIIAQNRIAQYDNTLSKITEAKIQGYLGNCTIKPGETVSGYFQLDYIKGNSLEVNMPINNVIYKFIWK